CAPRSFARGAERCPGGPRRCAYTRSCKLLTEPLRDQGAKRAPQLGGPLFRPHQELFRDVERGLHTEDRTAVNTADVNRSPERLITASVSGPPPAAPAPGGRPHAAALRAHQRARR